MLKTARMLHSMGLPAVFVLALSLTAGQAVADGTRTVEVKAEEFGFVPSTIEVKRGETIQLRLVNEGALSHNLHLRDRDEKTETIQSGNSDTLRFTAREKGEVEFFCNVPGHKQAGMTGSIVIQ